MMPLTREMVRRRVGLRCEYCRLPQRAVAEAAFHVEHIIAEQHGGPTASENLALACDRCNLFKGPNLTSIDPATHTLVRLFNPREDDWFQHFGQTNYEIVGLTDVGRATVRLLNMNADRRLRLRIALRLDLMID